MMPTQQGSIKLFRFAGIQVYLHWSWFLVAIYLVFIRGNVYNSLVWNAWEYIALFTIVLLHEFGHALSCRSVGGHADQIFLWPLGGVAYVDPPQRPGPILWSIAAGPLINVLLFPIFLVLTKLNWGDPSLQLLVENVYYMNKWLLIFNLMPFYPLDGGQILRSLLWFFVGPATSLMIASIIGVIGGGVLLVAALYYHETWFIIIAIFMLSICWRGLDNARKMARAMAAPPIIGPVCPSCGNSLPPEAVSGNSGIITCPYCGSQLEAR
jgi:Zn-dependent protease